MTERFTLQIAEKKLATAGGQRWVTMFKQGALELEYYAPRGTDPQQPHTRDEVYFVVSGSGWFVSDDGRKRFGPGDVLFLPAGVPHRFEDFTDDFAAWAIFSGD